MSTRQSPVATYRLQLTPAFGFPAAAALTPYLRSLGVSHLYLSPVFEARPGSTHGYDQTDPSTLRGELGGEAGFAELVRASTREGLGIVLDIVPNHVAAHHRNPWWWGLLSEGRESTFARYFDVDWDASKGRVVLPTLGEELHNAVEGGRIFAERDEHGLLRVRYGDSLFPIASGTWEGNGEPRGDDLQAVLARQHYRLEYWRTGQRSVNYRRFFDIHELAGVRVEDPIVFEAGHAGMLQLVKRGWIDGVRIDHIDGLRDPYGYLKQLRRRLDEVSPDGRRVFVLVEKILGRDERLPSKWPVDGTTGYEIAAAIAGLWVSRGGLTSLRRHGIEHGGASDDFEALKVRSKVEVAERLFKPELRRVVLKLLNAAAVSGMRPRAGEVERAVTAISSRMGVYRTYIDEDGASEADVTRIRQATVDAMADLRPEEHATVTFVRDVLTLRGEFDIVRGRAGKHALDAVMLWQQFTGPMTAKGVEDTAHYRDMALPALNEVGCEPVQALSDSQVAALLTDRAVEHSLNATATHDTKRGEDTRSRIAALTFSVNDTEAMLDAARKRARGTVSASTERLLMYTLAAVMPLEGRADDDLVGRVKAYMIKASREAKERTSWASPDEAYERAVDELVDRFMTGDDGRDVRELVQQAARVSRPRAAIASLVGTLLKTLAPGVPDFYQGCEFLDLSMVDPDNRRDVDWGVREHQLTKLQQRWASNPAEASAEAIRDHGSDIAKMFVTWRALRIRRWMMESGRRMELESFSSRDGWLTWTTQSGSRRCHIHAIVPRDAPPLTDETDQLTARPQSELVHGWPVRVTAWDNGDVRLIR